MSPEQKRKFNTVFGGVFMVTGIFAWALTAYFAVTPNPPKPAPVMAGATIDLASCQNSLRALGYAVTMKDKDITAHETLSLDDPKAQLDRATVAATVCRLPMKTFCMGQGCEKAGVTIVVSAEESGGRPASSAPVAAAASATASTAKP
jgi:hypothetical protein